MDSVTNLISRIKMRESIPEQEERFGDDYFLKLIKEEIESSVMPFLNGLHGEFFVMKDSLSFDILSEYPVNYIPVPRRAYARGVKQILWGRNGSTLLPTSNFGAYLGPNDQQSDLPGFIFENDAIKLVGRTTELYNNEKITQSGDAVELSYYHKVPNLSSDDLIQSEIVNVEFTKQYSFAMMSYAEPTVYLYVLSSLGLVNGQKVTVLDDSSVPKKAFADAGPYYVVDWKPGLLAGYDAIRLSTTPGGTTVSSYTTVDALTVFTTYPGTKIYSSVAGNANFPRTGTQIYDIYRKSTGAYLKLDCVCINSSITGSNFDLVSFTNDLSKEQSQILTNNQKRGFGSPFAKEMILLPADLNCYSPVPAEIDNLLTSCVVDRLLEALGDTEGRSNNAQIMQRTKDSIVRSFGERYSGATKKVIPIKNKSRGRYYGVV